MFFKSGVEIFFISVKSYPTFEPFINAIGFLISIWFFLFL